MYASKAIVRELARTLGLLGPVLLLLHLPEDGDHPGGRVAVGREARVHGRLRAAHHAGVVVYLRRGGLRALRTGIKLS